MGPYSSYCALFLCPNEPKETKAMNEIPKSFFDPFRDNDELRYAAKHRLESHIHVIGQWQCDVFRKGVLVSGGYWEPPNTFTYEGLDYLLDIVFYTTSKAASRIWYVGLFDLNVTPATSSTAAACLGAAGTFGALQAAEFDESTYPAYTTAAGVDGVITNSANKAEYTIASVSNTLYGAFLSTSNDPTETSCYLMAAKKFTSSRAVVADDEVAITYQITIANS